MNEDLAALAAEYHEYRLESSPTMALMMGDHRYDEKMEDGSRDGENVHVGRLKSFEARAMAIDSASLNSQETIPNISKRPSKRMTF